MVESEDERVIEGDSFRIETKMLEGRNIGRPKVVTYGQGWFTDYLCLLVDLKKTMKIFDRNVCL